MTTKNISIRWSRSCRNYLDCCRNRRSRSNRFPISPKPPRPITSRARRMGNVRAASLLPSLTPPSVPWSTTKPLPITRAFPVITCKSVSPRRCKACRSFGCTVFLPRMPKVGRSTPRWLGKEIGFYQDPVSDYGRLNSEMLRAVRLVVDTGNHDKNWRRQQVIDYMHANDINDALAQTEADRYIAWPGQALAYKMGQLTILKLRDGSRDTTRRQIRYQSVPRRNLERRRDAVGPVARRVEAWIKD